MDALGNLRELSLPGGKTIQYVLDGENHRIGKKVNGQMVEEYLYRDTLNPVAKLDGSGNLLEQFVYASKPNVPDYMIKGGSTYRIVSDQLGSPLLVIDSSSGSIAESISYDEFGNILSDTNPGFQPFGFAGCLYDQDTKLCHFGARDYDPAIGRWLSKDPIGFGGGTTNFYGYVSQDPVNFRDPTGLLCEYSQGSGHLSCWYAPLGPTQPYISAPGYSGSGPDKNNPASEANPYTGPIPHGLYTVGPPNSSKGPETRPLIPSEETVANFPPGRDPNTFRIHGDNPSTVGNSSEGCVIINGSSNRAGIPTGEPFFVEP